MEGIKDKREREKSILHRLHFEVRPNAAGVVTSFHTPAQRERIERFKEKSSRKREKGKREERKEEPDLISSSQIKGREWLQKAVCCGLFGRVSFCLRSRFDLAC